MYIYIYIHTYIYIYPTHIYIYIYIYICIYISAQPIKHVTPDAKPGKQITYIEIAHTTISNTITFKEDLFNSRQKAYTKTNSRNSNI